MLETFLNQFYFEKLDKQILKKIPYHLLIFISLSLIRYQFSLSITTQQILALFIISLSVFIILNSWFNIMINKRVDSILDLKDINKFMAKYSAVNDGLSSLTQDVKLTSETKKLFTLLFTSGLSLLIFNITLFSLVFYVLNVSVLIRLIILIPLIFYVYQDSLKADILDREEKEGEERAYTDFLEKYTVTNAIEKIPGGTVIYFLIFFFYRTIAPLASIKIPKITIAQHWVYKTVQLTNEIENLLIKEKGIAFEETKEYGGFTFKQLLNDEIKAEHSSTLFDKTPKENFPYIFDSSYYPDKLKQHPYQKKVCAVKILKKGKKTVNTGFAFFHLFQGIQTTGIKLRSTHQPDELKTFEKREQKYYDNKEPTTYYKSASIFYIILIGDQNIIHNLETQILTNTNPVPEQLLQIIT